MSTITINSTILDGNLGDGFEDNYASACELAEFTEQQMREHLSYLVAAGHELEIEVDVARNTCGYSRGVQVYSDDDSIDCNSIKKSLSQFSDVIWQRFCEAQ